MDADTIFTQLDQATTNLATDLATVMGPAGNAGQLDQQQLQQQLAAIGAPPSGRASQQDKQEYLAKLSTLLQQVAQTQIDNTIQAAQTSIASKAAEINNAIDAAKQAVQALEPDKQDDAAPTTAAEATFNSSIERVTTLMAQILQRSELYDQVGAKLNEAYERLGQDPNDAANNDQVDKIQTLRRNIMEQKNNLQREIVQYFDSAFRQDKHKTNLIDLKIPKDIHSGKGQMLMDNLKAYLRGRATEYYAIIPFLLRISDDFDSKQGIYWLPTAEDVPEIMRDAYCNQAEALYHVIMDQLTTEVKNKIKSTYKYGIHQQHEARCAIGDGPSAYFALISLYKPIKASHRDSLTEIFNVAWTHFLKGDPLKKIGFLRPKLVEANELQLQLNWSTTGKKIIQVLSRADHVMAQEIKQYEKGPSDPADTNTHLEDLFAAIEGELDKAKLVPQSNNKEKEWHAHNVIAHNHSNRRPCRYGLECTDTQCTRTHPRGFKRPREQDDTQDMPPSKHGKGSSDYGGKGNRGGKGYKGGKGKRIRGRPACEAQGCSQYTPHPSKSLCTTHFKEALDKGSVTKKDGTIFTLNRKSNDNKGEHQSNNTYGFSAEQMEGLKLMQEATAYTADAFTDIEPAAPASVKRARVAERLGKRANAATADERTKAFLSAINLQ